MELMLGNSNGCSDVRILIPANMQVCPKWVLP
jgi:hypothetical protein